MPKIRHLGALLLDEKLGYSNPNRPQSNKIQQGEVKKMR